MFDVNSGNAYWYKVAGSLKKKFDSPKEAEKFYGATERIDIGIQTCLSTENPSVAMGDGASISMALIL